MIPKKLYVRELDIDIFDEEVNVTRAWVANKPCAGRKEYTDLSQVWHSAKEEPKDKAYIIADRRNLEFGSFLWANQTKWEKFTEIFLIKRWAYVDELLPKGGEQ